MLRLEDAPIFGKKVLVRIDADVPLTEGAGPVVASDYRLQKMLPTICYLLNRKARIILMAHLGRPNAVVDSRLSLKPIYLHLAALLNRKVYFAPNPISAETREKSEKLDEGEIMGLENLRFYKGEEDNSRTFARKLASLAEVYVNDSFATAHRKAASNVAITEFLPSYAGLQLEREVEVLSSLTTHPSRPFIAIIGGAKIDNKLPVIEELLHKVDRVLVGGGVANAFLAATGVDIKKSIVSPAELRAAEKVYRRAKGKIVLPVDYLWGEDKILDIGPQSIDVFAKYLKTARTIFWAGPLGKFEDPKFQNSSKILSQAATQTLATTIAGGGNTLDMLENFGYLDKFSYVSIGGGASLRFLGSGDLPGLKALKY